MTAKILVVDDDVSSLEPYQSCLTANNDLVETAISGEKGHRISKNVYGRPNHARSYDAMRLAA
jgi:hypothetical protein